MTEQPGRFQDWRAARDYMLAGKATITVRSTQTGTRFTYRIRRDATQEHLFYVAALTTTDNVEGYKYLGIIVVPKAGISQAKYFHGRNSFIGQGAPSNRAIDWVWRRLQHEAIPSDLEIWHEGACGRCGRKLTVPESVASGFGPECATRVAR